MKKLLMALTLLTSISAFAGSIFEVSLKEQYNKDLSQIQKAVLISGCLLGEIQTSCQELKKNDLCNEATIASISTAIITDHRYDENDRNTMNRILDNFDDSEITKSKNLVNIHCN